MPKKLYNWESDFENLSFPDIRLKKRLLTLMEQLSASPNISIFLASGSRSEAKAAYRFLSNQKVTTDVLLNGAKEATRKSISACEDPYILSIQDTTSSCFGKHRNIEGMGYDHTSQPKGMRVHSSIAVTREGLPLGLLHQNYQARELSKDETKRNEKKQRPIEEKESYRWIRSLEEARKGIPEEIKLLHISDREGDFYELFDAAKKQGESFLTRIVQDRLVADGRRIITDLKSQAVKGGVCLSMARNTRENIPSRKVKMNFT